MNTSSHKRANKPAPITFESDDTEGSDLSYQSSDELEEEAETAQTTKKVQLFKQEMTRFFINHPELKNYGLLAECPDDQTPPPEKKGLWESLASDVLGESRRNYQLPSIEAFAKRLNLYRSKVERTELLDLILKEKTTLLRQIEIQAARNKKSENSIHSSIEQKLKKETGDVTYYSWRKNKQLEFRIGKAEQDARSSHKPPAQRDSSRRSKTPKVDMSRQFRVPSHQPKTEAGRQLQQELRKCPDEFAAKRTFINFLVRYRQTTSKQFASKPSLLQQGQKYYSQQSKQFVLLYPNPHVKKKLENEMTKQKLESMQLEDDSASFHFMKMLGKLAGSNLVKYWKSNQDCQA